MDSLTQILKINHQNPESDKIKEAVRIIKKGGLVVFPTETVYGLGCNALNKKAVARIFEVKKRDLGKPLLILIGQKGELKKYVKTITPLAKKLIKKYWPGPVTLVFQKSKIIPPAVVAGKDKVAIRLSSNKITQALIRESGLPLIGTSANLSGQNNINSPEEVIKQFRNKVDLIIDGGRTRQGKASTVVDVTGEKPVILRQGIVKIKI
jgi:L-threonylcarbamoyladenylate synthase